MPSTLRPVRGTHDILPQECRQRRHMLGIFFDLAECYGFGEIQTPIFEFTQVFARTLGDASDVVAKEMYSFTDRGGESLTLRPEFTAAAVRAFLSSGLQNELPIKWCYHGPAFRYERPQKGRQRQFHQVGVELLGAPEPEADAEVIALAAHYLESLGVLPKVRLEINSLGDMESRTAYREALVAYFTVHRNALSEESKLRLEKNPLRILDSKDKQDQEIIENAPSLLASLNRVSHDHLSRVKNALESINGITYHCNKRLVRGLDYYSHTVFEFVADDGLGAQNTVLAGGRYDGLVRLMGGQDVPGVGFAAGVERLLTLMGNASAAFVKECRPVAILPISDPGIAPSEEYAAAARLAVLLRRQNIMAEVFYQGQLGKRLKRANNAKASHAIMIGRDEILANHFVVKDLDAAEESVMQEDALLAYLKAAKR